MPAPLNSKSVLDKNVKSIDTVRPNLVYCGAYRPSVTLTSRDSAQVRHEGIVREPTKGIYVHDGYDMRQLSISLPKRRILASF